MTTLRALMAAGILVASFGLALAKLPPAPPLDEAGKVAAEAKKAKDAAAAEAAKAQQVKAEDRVAARYIAEQRAKGIIVQPTAIVTPGTGAVMTAQGNTPAGSAAGQSADAKAPTKPGGASAPATGADAAKDSNKK